MATRNIVPRADGEGSLGTSAKAWGCIYADNAIIDGKPVSGPLVGSVQAFAGNTSPIGWLLCDGSAVSRTDYADLFSVIGTTYGAGDGTDTFNLPNLIDKFVQGNATAGTVKSAGLPNITGTLSNMYYFGEWGTGTGALKGPTVAGTSGNAEGGTALANTGMGFDASLSNSIYGASNTVQPPALTMRYIIKY